MRQRKIGKRTKKMLLNIMDVTALIITACTSIYVLISLAQIKDTLLKNSSDLQYLRSICVGTESRLTVLQLELSRQIGKPTEKPSKPHSHSIPIPPSKSSSGPKPKASRLKIQPLTASQQQPSEVDQKYFPS